MPTVLSHAAVPLALGIGLGPRAVPGRLLAAGALASALPDADVLGFRLGVPYAAALGHRGLSHSLAFALLVGLAGAAAARRLGARPGAAFLFLLAATASHGALDACTGGGLGVAFLWPFSPARHFAPVRPIAVAPIGLGRFFERGGLSPRGAAVLASELRWIWLPAAVLAAGLLPARALAGRPAAREVA